MRLTLRHVLAVVTGTLAACSGNDSTPASTGPGSEQKMFLSLSAHADTIPESTSKTFTARVTDQTGFLKSAAVTWSSTDPNIASVANGNVTGVSPGAVYVIASITGARDSAHVVVTENELTLDVQPSAAAVAMGDTIDFVATLRTRSGDILAVNSFTWSSSDTSAAQFLGGGSLQTKREGDLLVTAEAMRRRGEGTVRVFKSPVASVTISPSTATVYKGSTVDLGAYPRDQNGRRVGANVTWGSSDHTKATVDDEGVVTGVGTGTVVITATAEAKTASATISVLGPPAKSVELTVPSSTLLVGTEMQATATPTDASGDPVVGRTIGWQSGNPSIATVTSVGTVKGINEGDVNINAVVDGVVATRRISVQGRTVASIEIVPGSPSVSVSQSAQLAARVLDQNGNEINKSPVTWSSTDPGVATISASGVLYGVSSGSTSITATLNSASAEVMATVVGVPVASVRLSPASSTLPVNGQATLVAEALDGNSNVLAGRAVSWSSQDPTIAYVNSVGVVRALSGGSTTITATIEGQSANATITVNAAPPAAVASVSVSLSRPTLNVGETSQATAVLRDANGNTLTGRVVTWSTLDPAVATVDANGLVTAASAGTIVILARSEGTTGSASLNVNTPSLAAVAKVMVDVPTQHIKVGESVQSVVRLYDASDNELGGRTITYRTDNPAVISVSATGVVKGLGVGYTKLRATSGGVTNTETMYVTAASAAPPSTITVSPSSTTLSVGQTKQATASASDAQGASVSTTYTWTTSNSTVATVSSSGLVTAVGAGSATIRAASSGITGSMDVTVTTPPPSNGTVASVLVSLSSSSITIGGTAQATAIAKDANGAVITGKSVSWSLGVSLLANISTNGLVTGLVAGLVPVRATVDGIVGTSNLTITALQPPPPPPTSTVVELPRTYLNYSYPAKTGQTIVVPAGGNLQNAINSAQRGDEIVLTAGAKYSGNFTLPAKSGSASNGWIVIRSDKSSQLPPAGTRVTPSDANLMAIIETPSVAPAIKVAGPAHGWWLVGLNVTVSSSLTSQQYGIIELGQSRGSQTSLSMVPNDLVLDRMYIHGQTTTNTSRCVALNSGRTQITDSYLTDCHGRDFDSQAIAGWNGPGPYKIVNNTLIGAGENIMFGGGDPGIPGLVPSDIEIRRNYLYTPVSWKNVWLKKNLFELKNAVRVLIEGNVFDGSWTHGQTGWAMIIKSANQGGNCSWCRSTDVTIRRNLIRNAGAGINVASRDDNPNTDTTARRVHISETVLENIGVAPFTGDNRGFQFLKNTFDMTVERTVLDGSLQAALMLDVSPGSARAVFRNNVWEAGQYGVIATGSGPGTNSLNSGAPGATWTTMTLVGPSQSGYPTGTSFVASEGSASLASQLRSIVAQATAGVIVP